MWTVNQSTTRAYYLLILGERAAVGWVLSQRRMAFSEGRRQLGARLRRSDRLFLYTTRGCFHNPTKHRGRVMGLATVATEVSNLEEPVVLAGRSFTTGCELRIDALAEPLDGLELASVIEDLHTFADIAFWPNALRTPLVRLGVEDARLLVQRFRPFARQPDAVLEGWMSRAEPRRPKLARW